MPLYWVNVVFSAFQPVAQTSSKISARSARQRSSDARSPVDSAVRTIRSMPVQASTLLWVKRLSGSSRTGVRTPSIPKRGA